MTINFNVAPYYDDYNDEDGYLRVLFRPGYAVQARELTQLQTILQKQVSRFGDHIFKNGSQVIPGAVNVDDEIHFAKLDALFENQSVDSYIDNFRNKIVTGIESGVKALVIDTHICDCIVPEDSDIPTLYYKIEQTNAEGDIKRFIPGETLVAFEDDNTVEANYRLVEDQVGDIYVNVRSFGDAGQAATSYSGNPVTDVLGYGYAVEVEEGIYYIDGFFVRNPELHLYVGRFTDKPTCRVGFRVDEQIITPEEEPQLSDNAQGTTNFAAPGAHRYKINLSLVRLPLDTVDDLRFIELIRIIDGRVQVKIERSSYSELEKTLARRTFDESGNYEVTKFKLTTREHLNSDGAGVYPPIPTENVVSGQVYGDPDKFVLAVDPGKAYIQGFEIESTATQFITFDKARENTATGEEGGHIVREEDFPIQTPVGNYVIVNNVFNFPAINNFPEVNLYSVSRKPPNGSTITDGSAPDALYKVGSARVKSFQLHSGGYSGGDTTEFKLGLFNIVMDRDPSTGLRYVFEDKVKSVAEVGSGSQLFTSDVVTIESSIIGSASISSGSTAVAGIGTLFIDQVQVGDILLVDGVKAGVVASVSSNIALTLEQQVASNFAGILSVARAQIVDPSFDSLIFKSSFSPIKTLRGQDANGNDTIDSSILTVRRVLTNTSDAAGGLWQYQLTSSFEAFQSTQDLSNYTLYYTHPLTGTRVFVNISSGDLSLGTDNRQITISNPGIIASQEYTLIASVEQRRTTARERTKILNVNVSHNVTGKKPVSEPTIVLPHADVLRLKDIRVSPGNFDNYVELNSVSILDKYVLDNGQRISHYQAASISLRPNIAPPSGAIRIIYDYFSYSGNGNYFSVDSYTSAIDNETNDFGYEDIPSFDVRGTDGVTQTVFLHDVIDFRPVISGLNSFTPELPKIGTSFNTSIAYYLSRFDKLILDSVGRFVVIKGIPEISPQEPKDPTEGMVLASIFVPAYTKDYRDIKVFPRDNKRYTMREIGNLERRIQNLEYYVSLTLLEQQTQAFQIKDAQTGLDRFKNGFIVDQFTGHGVGDVKSIDYRIAVDDELNELRPMHFTDALDLVEDINSADERLAQTYKKNGDIITLPYTEDLFIFNPYGTRTIDVNPYKIGAFKGEITLNPEGDNWKDTDRRPDLQVTDDNNFDAIRFLAQELGVTGTRWNAWQTTWTGSSTSASPTQVVTRGRTTTGFQTVTRVDTGVQSRSGIRTSIQSSVNTQDYGDRVVDISFAEYMRSRPVLFTAVNLKPNGRFYPFFDGQAVTDYVRPADLFKVTRTSSTIRFNPDEIGERVIATHEERTVNGIAEPAFQIGDILRQEAHTPVVIQNITNITAPEGATSFNLSILSSNDSGLRVGHHVQLYNLAPVRVIRNLRTRRGRGSRVTQTTTTRTVPTSNTSRELNNRVFRITSIATNNTVSPAVTTITLARPDGGLIGAFEAYNRSAAYSGADGGRLFRIRASCVVAFAGAVDQEDANGPIVQDLHVVNLRGGFSIGEALRGRVLFENSATNTVLLTGINGNETLNDLPVYKQVGDAIRTDRFGSCVGVFTIPNSEALRFRTGERDFKLTDNISNSDADFDSKGEVTYFSQGITLAKERTIVNSRQANFVRDRVFESIPVRRVTVSTRVVFQQTRGHDPLAQTFTVQSEGGAFVTGVDLYFSEAGVRPITVELRNTNNGVPSSKVIPLSIVTLTPQQVSVSDDGSVATRFQFKAPIYLVDNETYALVVKTDEPGCQIFVSEIGETDIISGNIVTVQPLTGSLYLSQNSREFEINPLFDMKFRLYKSTFDINQVGTIQLKAEHARDINLPENPFEISTGTTIVRVRAPRHGFQPGEIAYIEGVAEYLDDDTQQLKYYGTAEPTYGIPASILNGPQTVIAQGLDVDYFCFELDAEDEFINPDTGLLDPQLLITGEAGNETTVQSILNQFVKGNYGGTGVTCSRQLLIDYLFLKSDSVVPTGSSLEWQVQAIDSDGTPTGYRTITENTNFTFGSRKIVRSFENEEILSQVSGIVRPSLTYIAKLRSENPNISPIVDLQKVNTYAIRNLIDNPTEDLVNILGVDDRTLLEEGNVTSADIGVVPATGDMISYYLTSIYGNTITLPDPVVQGGDRTFTLLDTSQYNWIGTGDQQEPYEYLSIGDVLYSDSVTSSLEVEERFGVVKSVNASTLVLEGTTGKTITGNPTFKILSKIIRGVGTKFIDEIPAGTTVNGNAGDFVGITASVQSDTKATLSSFAQFANNALSFETETTEAKLTFSNSNGFGVISTNIDTADNLLALTRAGKYLYLSGFFPGIDGKFLVHTVETLTDNTTFVGNSEDDRIVISVTPEFTLLGATPKLYTLDLINDYIYFKGTGTITAASTSSKTVTLANSSATLDVSPGDVITLKSFGEGVFDSDNDHVGTVESIENNNSITLTANAAQSIAESIDYYIRKQATDYRIAQLDKFVEDWAPIGATNYANYLTRPLVLSNPADSIKVLFDANVPTGTELKVYYKAWTGSLNPDNINYVDSGFSTSSVDAENVFSERTIDITDIVPFTNLVIKIVMKATNPSIVPKVKNLRIITHS